MTAIKESTYVIGDVHGCFTQFMELLERIEARDSNARFILVGDIISRGPEDEEMLAWAYENITLDGKYQMVLGNHDDTFIEIFGKGEFQTIYSLSRHKPNKTEFRHLKGQEALMYQYAGFLASQPLFRKLEVNGQKYIIAHAWYLEENAKPDKLGEYHASLRDNNPVYTKRFRALWHRDREEYKDGEFEDEYEPVDGEILIHGHTPTLTEKDKTHRIYSPGKIWQRKNSINIDCGLVFNVAEYDYPYAKFGNLAAYHLETGEAEYLWDIVDEYAKNNDEYYEEKLEREQKERDEAELKANLAWEKYKEPYLKSFYKQVFGLEEVPDRKDYKYKASFNFLQHRLWRVSVFNEAKSNDDTDLNAKDELLIALDNMNRGSKEKVVLYKYVKRFNDWISVPLDDDWLYQIFTYEDENYLLGVDNEDNYELREAKGILYSLNDYAGASILIKYCHDRAKAGERIRERILDFEEELDDRGIPTGNIAWDFCCPGIEGFTIKTTRKYKGTHFVVNVLNRAGDVIAEISRRLPWF